MQLEVAVISLCLPGHPLRDMPNEVAETSRDRMGGTRRLYRILYNSNNRRETLGLQRLLQIRHDVFRRLDSNAQTDGIFPDPHSLPLLGRDVPV